MEQCWGLAIRRLEMQEKESRSPVFLHTSSESEGWFRISFGFLHTHLLFRLTLRISDASFTQAVFRFWWEMLYVAIYYTLYANWSTACNPVPQKCLGNLYYKELHYRLTFLEFILHRECWTTAIHLLLNNF